MQIKREMRTFFSLDETYIFPLPIDSIKPFGIEYMLLPCCIFLMMMLCLLPPNDLPNVYLIIAHGLRQAGGEEPGQEVLGGGGAAHLTHRGGEGAGTVPGQHQGGGQQQQ